MQSSPSLDYSLQDVRLAIPNDGVSELRSIVPVSGLTGTLQNVEVHFNIEQEDMSELEAELIGPNGEMVTLKLAPTGTTAATGYSGVFQAVENVASTFSGQLNGNWTLVIRDTDDAHAGSLKEWALVVTTSASALPAILPAKQASISYPGTANEYHVHVSSSADVTLSFGDFRPGTINGYKFSDDNGNGIQDGGERGLGGIMLFVDLNDNGIRDQAEPQGFTLFDDPATQFNEEGYFTIGSVRPGTNLKVREELLTGFRQTVPVDDGIGPVTSIVVPVLNSGGKIGTSARELAEIVEQTPVGQVPNLPSYGLTFANQPVGSIRGTKWRDTNGNGVRDEGEAGWAGVRVYLDTNGNAVWDSTEPFAFTTADDPLTVGVDETGAYSLNNLPMGNYVVREQIPAGSTQTTTGLQPVYSSTLDGPSVPAGWSSAGSLAISQLDDRSFLGAFANQSVQLSVAGIPTHNLLHVEFDLVVLGGWNGGGGPASGDEDAWQFQVAASVSNPQYQFTTTFANTTTPGDPLLANRIRIHSGARCNPRTPVQVRFAH